MECGKCCEGVKNKRKFIAGLLLLSLICLIYFNTLNVPWQFDDFGSIVDNPNVAIKDLGFESIFHATLNAEGKVHRPVSRLSFGLNWFFGQSDVTGFHLVNVSVHFITAFFLFLTILNLLTTPNFGKNYFSSEKRYFIALLATVLWAANPIQTQAVTYIVQRMASMAAMFYIISIWFYLKCRLSSERKEMFLYALGALISLLLAIGSKQNAVTLPMSILLIEAVFFPDFQSLRVTPRFRKIGLLVFFLLLLFSTAILSNVDVMSVFQKYEERPFTIAEKALTEPRVLIFYLSQIFYPIPSRLSLEHDIIFSSTIFEPWSTFATIAIIPIVIGFALYYIKTKPLISFAILFFFIGHLVESTLIPLELIYEHRNYLPSLFIFLPVSAGLLSVLEWYKRRKIYYILVSSITLIIVGFGMGTHTRNMVWATEMSLWKDAAEKAPDWARPYQNLAIEYSKIYGPSEMTIGMLEDALKKRFHRITINPSEIYKNIGTTYYKLNQYDKALFAHEKALSIRPDRDPYSWLMTLATIGREDEAMHFLREYVPKIKATRKPPFLKLSGAILIKQGRYDEAVSFLKQALTLGEPDSITLMLMGIAFSRSGNYEQAERYCRWALLRSGSNRIAPLLALIEISLTYEEEAQAELYFEHLIEHSPLSKIEKNIKGLNNNFFSPLKVEFISKYLANKLKTIDSDYFLSGGGSDTDTITP